MLFQAAFIICLIVALKQACIAQSIAFNLLEKRFVAFFEPATYVDAVKTCSSDALFGGGVAGALLPASQLGELFLRLALAQPQTEQVC